MTVHYWLAPVTQSSPLTLGAERFVCEPERELAEFRQALDRGRPKLLVSFKTHLLAADQQEGQENTTCGTDVVPFELSTPGDIVFDGEQLRLSDCGAAMMDKLADLQTAGEWPKAIDAMLAASTLSAVGRSWIETMRGWLARGWLVILLKEEL